MYWRYWLKVGAAGAVAVGAAIALYSSTRPPALTEVGVLTAAVGAMQSVPHTIVRWTEVTHPPEGAVTIHQSWGSLVASEALPAGTILTANDFSTPQGDGLHAGEVQWMVSVSASSSGLPNVGQRVDVWSDINGVYAANAYGVRVIGLYSQSGGSVTAGSSAPGLVALAVPSGALGVLLNIKTPTLVVDPNQSGFRLAMASSSTPAATPLKTDTTASKKGGSHS